MKPALIFALLLCEVGVVSAPLVSSASQAGTADATAESQCRKATDAPKAFLRGMSLVYASAYRDLATTDLGTAASVAARGIVPGKQDALSVYDVSAEDATSRLRFTYALAISHGLLESSGNPTEGADCSNASASKRRPCSYYRQTPHSNEAEAGLFQASANSLGSHPILRTLWNSYNANKDRCLTDVFGSGLRNLQREEFGEGEVKDFQDFTKSCPAFAVEYEAVMLRVNARHFGPISRREAKIEAPCVEMLRQAESSPQAPHSDHVAQ